MQNKYFNKEMMPIDLRTTNTSENVFESPQDITEVSQSKHVPSRILPTNQANLKMT